MKHKDFLSSKQWRRFVFDTGGMPPYFCPIFRMIYPNLAFFLLGVSHPPQKLENFRILKVNWCNLVNTWDEIHKNT